MTEASPSLRVRRLTGGDLPFADSLRALAGWNQTLTDWERFLALEPNGGFLAEWNGAPVGTATTTVYGTDLAWIGMVLVHPDHRRRGIGGALLRHCLEYLQGRGIRCLGLDATPEGRTVYQGLGFRDAGTLTRWHRGSVDVTSLPAPPHGGVRLRQARSADFESAVALDAAAFGVARRALLDSLNRQSLTALVAEADSGRVAAWGLLREGARARYLGPVVADLPAAGLPLLDALLVAAADSPVFCDLPDLNAAAVSWVRSRGFTAQRSLTRMFLGGTAPRAVPHKSFAIAGPELG